MPEHERPSKGGRFIWSIMVQGIDSSQVKGEAGTGYEGPENGPFSCANCEYFRAGSCGQKTMMERSSLPRTENDRVIVDPNGCCEYVHRKSKKKGHWLARKG
jgi:hypothetical protein